MWMSGSKKTKFVLCLSTGTSHIGSIKEDEAPPNLPKGEAFENLLHL